MEDEEKKEQTNQKPEQLKWSNMDGFEKTFWLLSIILSIAFIVTLFIKTESFNIINFSLFFASILFNGIAMIKRNKKSAISTIIVSLICAAVMVILYFNKVI